MSTSGHCSHKHSQSHHDHHGHCDHQSHHDHHGHHNHHEGQGHHCHGNFKEIFFKSLPIGIIILILSPMMGTQLFFQFTFPYSDILVAILSTILFVYGGKPFYQGGWNEIKEKAPGMMALVTLGISVSYFYSLYAVFSRYILNVHEMDFFFELASLILIMLLGHWIEMEAVGEAGNAQESLAKLLPKKAHLVGKDGQLTEISTTDLKIGDTVQVQAGESIPADGVIISGSSRINEALLTGESKPVKKEVGDRVIGGSTNDEGVLLVEVTEMGEKSFIAQVQHLISEAQNQPSKAESVAQKIASYLFYIAVTSAIIALLVWTWVADLETAVRFTITTLVVACPHALGLAIPLVVARSTSLGAQHGLLVKDREALEKAVQADVILLDKTGTLTTGQFDVLKIENYSTRHTEEDILALLAGIESGSTHPIAQSILSHAKDKQITPALFKDVKVHPGVGMSGNYQNAHYELISQQAYHANLPAPMPNGATVSILLENDELIGAIALGDKLKENSRHLITVLKEKNIRPIMLTGDNEKAAQAVADELGIDYYANQSPHDKYQMVRKLKETGQTTIMVGDGINDAPSLALADVGVAIGAGTQVAMDSADIILTQSNPGDIEDFIQLADQTTRKMKQNLAWGAGYNFIVIPLAAGIFAPIGLTLSPAAGAILMSLSTVIVAFNALTLKIK